MMRGRYKQWQVAMAIMSTACALLLSRPGLTEEQPATSLKSEGKRPNIVLVMTDDQGYGDLSCHGNSDVETPHLDQLYRQSVRFTNFHVDPTCAPTRAALITGRYSLSTGVWHTIAGRSFLQSEEITIANVLKGAGYATGTFGKWHLGDNYPCRPHDRGFDQAIYHLRDNTLMIFMTDNGTAGPWYPKEGEDHSAGLRGIKGSIYEGGHRVPFFVRWPNGGIGGGHDVDHVAAHIDVLPTLMELSGATRPSGPPLHGRSLAPLLRDPDTKWEQRAIVVNSQRIAIPQKYKDFVVMSDPWRLVGKDELYNLSNDREQKNNVAAIHPKIVEQLLKTYEEWWDKTSGRAATLVPITVGSERENPALLTAHDWHANAKGIPWHQDVVKETPAHNGHWEITVAEPGHYRITLMERPLEARHPIAAVSAVLEVEGKTHNQIITSGVKQIHFDIDLESGRTQLKSTLTNQSGAKRGAYYASVLRLTTP